jgi:hypothetical protein
MGAKLGQEKNWACTKTKTGLDAALDFEIFEKNQFVNNKSTGYFCKVYYRCHF